MNFSSLGFIVFFACVTLFLAINDSRKSSEKVARARHVFLLCASYFFYGCWDWRFCFLMLGLTLISYFAALSAQRGHKRAALAVSVVAMLSALAVFKYAGFFVDSFCDLFGVENARSLNIILPVGISFYTFQTLSYVIDVYRGKLPPTKNLVKYALYVSFFPQLVAGPIVRAADFMPQLDEDRRISRARFSRGIQQFTMGLVKKIVIADNISVFVDQVFELPGVFDWRTLLLAVVAYSIQIYFDFSGYSDMAIGCSRICGYDLNVNFSLPYISKNVSEFWKRWHISLSTWLQEYLYIPLGGNRKGRVRTYINLMITMLLGGLWHGAAWNFVAWGALHGAALCVHKIFRALRGEKRGSAPVNALCVLATYAFVCLAWIFFRAPSIGAAFSYISYIFTFREGVTQISSWALIGVAALCAATFTACLRSRRLKLPRAEGFSPELDLRGFAPLTLLLSVLGIIFVTMYTGDNPFIYFQF